MTDFSTPRKRTPQEVAALVRECSDALVRYALCMVGEENAAEEIALRAMADFVYRNEHRALSRAYLYRMAYSRAVDYLRRKRREVPLGAAQWVSATSSPEEEAEAAERHRVLYQALSAIAPDYRNALYLSVLEGFGAEETARIMGKNVKQVYNLLARAKVALREQLNKEGYGYEDL